MKISFEAMDHLTSARDEVDAAMDEADSEALDALQHLRRFLNDLIGDMEVDE